MTTKLAIFDLGNVLFECDFRRAVDYWSNLSGVPSEQISHRFDVSEYLEDFERGDISEDEFFRALNNRLKISISREHVVKGWNAIYGRLILRSYIAIRKIAKTISSVALTNTNETHCRVWKQRYGEQLRVFRKLYVSSELGMRKPERRLFQLVLREWGAKSEEVIFFDDVEEHLESAASLGIRSVLVKSDETVHRWACENIGCA